jgi:F-type H+-transporting ATPase subunit delta
MKYQETATRYAKALFAIAQEKNHIDSVVSQMEQVTKQIHEENDINYFMTSPIMKKQNQKELLVKFFENQPLREEVQNLLFLLVEKKRFFLLTQITRALQNLVDSTNGVVRGVVKTPALLNAADQKGIEKAISTYTGKKIQLEFKEDKSVIAGTVAQVGSYTFDDSLKTQIGLMFEHIIKKESLLNGN